LRKVELGFKCAAAMIPLHRPEQEVNYRAEDSPVNLAFALTQPSASAQCLVWVAADQRVYELVEGNEDVEDVSQHDYSVAAEMNRSSICAAVMLFC